MTWSWCTVLASDQRDTTRWEAELHPPYRPCGAGWEVSQIVRSSVCMSVRPSVRLPRVFRSCHLCPFLLPRIVCSWRGPWPSWFPRLDTTDTEISISPSPAPLFRCAATPPPPLPPEIPELPKALSLRPPSRSCRGLVCSVVCQEFSNSKLPLSRFIQLHFVQSLL